MIERIATILKNQLTGLDFVDKIAGLVHVVEVTQDISDNQTTVERYPIACDVLDPNNCLTGSSTYKDLVPNDSYKSVLYFEGGGTIRTGMRGKANTYTTRLRLVGWLNGKKLGSTSCTTSGEAIASIIATFPGGSFNDGHHHRIKISVVSEVRKTKEIFSAYTYDHKQKFLMKPFDYFAIEVEVRFQIDPSCVSLLAVGTEDPCDNG